MDGERDFSSTELSPEESSLDGIDGYDDLLLYLQTRDSRAEPINAQNAKWSGLKARGIFLPFGKMANADLSGADLRDSEFRRADLSNCNLKGSLLSGASMIVCNLQKADLTDAKLRGTDMYEASVTGASLRNADMTGSFLLRLSFKDADVTGASMAGSLFYRTDFRGAVGLDHVVDLGSGIFHRPIVTAREKQIIEKALEHRLKLDLQTH